jgi:hypothetical protein
VSKESQTNKANVRFVNGYMLLYVPDHPSAMKSKNWLGYVYEHIIVAESFMKRKLTNKEVVHHLDGNRLNNREENLIVLERSQHVKLHTWLEASASLSKDNDEQRLNSGEPKLRNKVNKAILSEAICTHIERAETSGGIQFP